jgi:hypothetical protein
MATTHTTVHSSPGEVTCESTWSIPDFSNLMTEFAVDATKDTLKQELVVPFNSSGISFTSYWTLKCWPNIVGKGMRVLLHLGNIQPFSPAEIYVMAAVQVLGRYDRKVTLKEVTSLYKEGSDIVDVSKEYLDPDTLMPGSVLTMYCEIKIFPTVVTVTRCDHQHLAAVPSTPKNIFKDMAESFVDMKVNSVLIVFENGEQKCHTFPLAARNSFGGALSFL